MDISTENVTTAELLTRLRELAPLTEEGQEIGKAVRVSIDLLENLVEFQWILAQNEVTRPRNVVVLNVKAENCT